MKVVLIGVGQAGGKITQALAEFDHERGFEAIKGAFAVNSAQTDLQSLDIETMLIGQDRVKGHGVGGDNELGAQIMEEAAPEVLDNLDGHITSKADAIFVVAGLGGGTGSGGAPMLTKKLQRVYQIPIYGIGVLPGRDEGGIYQANAGRSLKTFSREATSVLLIDNDSWKSAGQSVEEGFDEINANIAERVGLLLAAGEAIDGVGESVVDSSEIINTLKGGSVSSLGYASAEADEDPEENINVITSTTRRALLTGTSLPNAVKADKALLIVAGHPDRIARKGVERARKWLEEETGSLEVRGGDFPLNSDRIATLLVLGGVEDTERLSEFMERAEEAEKQRQEETEDAATAFQNDELDDLF